MSLTLMDVRAIAELARLELERNEEEAMLGQLNAFFRIVEQMGTVDTSGVEPGRKTQAFGYYPALI